MILPLWAETELKKIVGVDYDKLCNSFDKKIQFISELIR